MDVRQRAVNQLNKIDRELAERVADNVGVTVPEENEEVKSDKKDSQLTMEKYNRPLPGHSVAVLINGDIDPETLKKYAKEFASNGLNYAFIGKQQKELSDDITVNDTYETGHSTLFDSLVILSDGNGLVPDAEEFAALAYKHKKPIIFNEAAAKDLQDGKIKLDAPGVFTSDNPDTIVKAFDKVRYWDRK